MKIKLATQPNAATIFFLLFSVGKKNCSWPNAAIWPRAAKQTQNALRDPFRDPNTLEPC